MIEQPLNRRVHLGAMVVCVLLTPSYACTGDRRGPASEQGHETPTESTATKPARFEQPSAVEASHSGGDILIEFPVCDGSPYPKKCDKGSSLFAEKCRICHGRTGAGHRTAPTLIGLLGRKRTFLNGRSLIADEAYIRRSVIDHNSNEEYVPGYHGTLEKVEMLSHPDATLRASHRAIEAQAWKQVVGDAGLSPYDVNALVAFIEWLDLEPLPEGSVRVEELVPGKTRFDTKRIRKEIGLRLESIRLCYEFELEKELDLQGEITVEFVGLPRGRLADGKVIRDTLEKPLLTRCVADAVGHATAACSVPPRDGTVTFVLAPIDKTAEPPPNGIPR
jgi:hypothetical protein